MLTTFSASLVGCAKQPSKKAVLIYIVMVLSEHTHLYPAVGLFLTNLLIRRLQMQLVSGYIPGDTNAHTKREVTMRTAGVGL